MKKTIIPFTLALVAASALGQGTINFSNSSTALTSPPDRLVRFDASAASKDSAFVAGSAVFTNANAPGLRAQLYFGASTASEGSLTADTAAGATFRASTSTGVGTWLGAQRTL